jgi:hypothetical protein
MTTLIVLNTVSACSSLATSLVHCLFGMLCYYVKGSILEKASLARI